MTEKKYIIDEWDVVEIIRCAEKAGDQKLADYFRALKPVEPLSDNEILLESERADRNSKDSSDPWDIRFGRAIEQRIVGELK